MTPSPNKGYFTGPEGKVNATTWGVIALGFLVIVWVMGGKIGDYLVSAADNTLHFAIVAAVLLFIVAALIDPKKRLWYLFRSIVRWLTSMFIELDPIGIRKSYVERLQARYAEFQNAVGTLRGQLISAQRKADAKAAEIRDQEAKFAIAVKKNDRQAELLLANSKVRAQGLLTQYVKSINNLTRMQTVVVRYQEICGVKIADLQDDIKTREEQMALTKATRGISGAISGILRGLPEADMYEEVGAVIDTQYDQALGEFDNILDMTKGAISNADLSDDAALEAALSKYELSSGTKQVAAPAPAPQQSTDYSDLLK
jgi:hypothetical protein